VLGGWSWGYCWLLDSQSVVRRCFSVQTMSFLALAPSNSTWIALVASTRARFVCVQQHKSERLPPSCGAAVEESSCPVSELSVVVRTRVDVFVDVSYMGRCFRA
jgi:hypothetical protein